MGVPRAHSTRSQKGRRRSHLSLAKTNLPVCFHCGKPKMAHRVCRSCGYYDGQEIVNVLAKELKKKEKQRK